MLCIVQPRELGLTSFRRQVILSSRHTILPMTLFYETFIFVCHCLFLYFPFSFLARKPGDTYWTTFLSVENALREVQRTMPDVRDQREITPGEQDKRIHPSLLLGRACNQAATILLNLSNAHDGNGNEKNSYAKDQALETTRRMAEDVRQFSPLATFRSYHLCLGVCVQYYHDPPAVFDDISSSFFALLSSMTTPTRRRCH